MNFKSHFNFDFAFPFFEVITFFKKWKLYAPLFELYYCFGSITGTLLQDIILTYVVLTNLICLRGGGVGIKQAQEHPQLWHLLFSVFRVCWEPPLKISSNSAEISCPVLHILSKKETCICIPQFSAKVMHQAVSQLLHLRTDTWLKIYYRHWYGCTSDCCLQ